MPCTSGFLTALECPDPASPDPLAGLRGPTSEGRGEEGERKGREEGEEGNGRDPPPFAHSWNRPWNGLEMLYD